MRPERRAAITTYGVEANAEFSLACGTILISRLTFNDLILRFVAHTDAN
jgi:hypothetical protein